MSRLFFKFVLAIGMVLVVSCSKSLVPKNNFQPFLSSIQRQNIQSNNLYFPDFQIEPPLELVKQFRPASAAQQRLQINGNILFVPTKDGKLETYDLINGKKIGRKKLSSKIRANIFTVDNNILIASEYGKKSLTLLDLNRNKRVWSADLGSLMAVPKVVENKVFVPSLYNGLICLDLNNGEKIWQYDPESQLHTSPVIFDSSVYQIAENGKLFALNINSGLTQWQLDLGGPGLVNPVLSGNNLICPTSTGKVLSYSLDGEKNWEYDCGAQIKRSPSATRNKVIVADQNGIIHALNMSDGSLLWQYNTDTVIGTKTLLNDKYVIFGTLDNRMLFLNIDSGQAIWELGLFGRCRTDPLPWQNQLIIGSENNYIYVLSNDENYEK